MEATGIIKVVCYIGIIGGILGLYGCNFGFTIMENQMEKNMENEMETGIIMVYR